MRSRTPHQFDLDILLGVLTPETRAALKGAGPEDVERVACGFLAEYIFRSSGKLYKKIGRAKLARILSDPSRPLVANFIFAPWIVPGSLMPQRADGSGGPAYRSRLNPGAASELAEVYAWLRVAADMGICDDAARSHFSKGVNAERSPYARLVIASLIF
jgi:hypothetical protein